MWWNRDQGIVEWPSALFGNLWFGSAPSNSPTVLYKLTQQFPREEIYGLTSQLRRAGVSVASNIAEGYGRRTRGEYRSFLGIARGSTLEIQTQLVIARNLGLGDTHQISEAEKLADETSSMLWTITQKL